MRKRQFMASMAGLALAAGTLLSMGLTAGPASAAAASGCPANQKGLLTDNQVSASFSNTNSVTTTYTFSSLANENPSGGVPGLMKYCVYPSPSSFKPASITPQAVGDNGKTWTTGTGSNNFAFVRPGGDPSDIGLRNQDVTMGKATWSNLPASQSFVLHVNDPGVCTSLYGAGSSGTCFVLPGPPRQPPPAPCSAGDANVAYNSMPSDVVNCVNPAIGFEAQSANEFGNAVSLNLAGGPDLASLKVDFQSFACQTGHWNGNPDDPSNTVEPCQFTDPAHPTFQWPVTANIYTANLDGSPGALLATSGPITQTIPYRPAHDGTGHCANPDSSKPDSGNRWWNQDALGGAGACQSSIATVLTFNFPSGILIPTSSVIWTVSFATSDYGTLASPKQGTQACSSGSDLRFPGLADGGCPYDSLNVGDNGNTGGADFPVSHITNAPYVGADMFSGSAELSSTSGAAYCDGGTAGTGFLRLDSPTSSPPCGWDGLRPLGEIITH